MGTRLEDYDYELPKELVAPYPTPKRSDARLLVLDRSNGKREHRIFKDLVEYLRAGDLLVLNNTKVLPARIFGRKTSGGKTEALLLKNLEGPVWEVLLKPSGRIKKGARILFGENSVRLEGKVLDEPSGVSGVRLISFEDENFREKLERIGRIPLPPYIDRPDEAIDRDLYQTVFAEKEGAVASPTAGLHFDEELLNLLRQKGIEICYVTLHVGYGTFQPIQTDDLSKHQMYEEEFEVTKKAAEQIHRALSENRRIIACGTTVVRVLETIAEFLLLPSPPGGERVGTQGKTRLFIYPPYEFKIVDAMITNFHLPRTTLLMLVSAFAGREQILEIYREAVEERYRFYSYGDAMLIL